MFQNTQQWTFYSIVKMELFIAVYSSVVNDHGAIQKHKMCVFEYDVFHISKVCLE